MSAAPARTQPRTGNATAIQARAAATAASGSRATSRVAAIVATPRRRSAVTQPQPAEEITAVRSSISAAARAAAPPARTAVPISRPSTRSASAAAPTAGHAARTTAVPPGRTASMGRASLRAASKASLAATGSRFDWRGRGPRRSSRSRARDPDHVQETAVGIAEVARVDPPRGKPALTKSRQEVFQAGSRTWMTPNKSARRRRDGLNTR